MSSFVISCIQIELNGYIMKYSKYFSMPQVLLRAKDYKDVEVALNIVSLSVLNIRYSYV